MLSHLYKDIPVVAVCNISETFFEFLNRAEEPTTRTHLIHGEQYRGDRTLIWLGDPKLVFVTFPIPHAEYLCQHFGYQGTSYMAPADPSPWLSLDILRESRLITRLVEYAGAEQTVQLIPYATTPQFFKLVETLRTEYGLNVLLPESPAPGYLWLRDYVDTKAGFRVLASRWLPNSYELLPPGIICRDTNMAATVVHWFCANGQACVVKTDDGENGIGNFILYPGDFSSPEGILRKLQSNPFLCDGWVTVEKFIHSSKMLSPSLELFVPPLGTGRPEITYLSNQLFLEFGDFCGVLVSRELLDTKWYPLLAESGLLIATELQEMGYVGHFDLDAIVDDEERVFLLEVNTRRTGGTHVHEFARFFFGPDYLNSVVLLSHDAMKSGTIGHFHELLEAIGDLLYPMQQEQRGVIVTVTSALAAGEFGCIIVASSTEEAVALQKALIERIHNVSGLR
jgi:hypothetical protein